MSLGRVEEVRVLSAPPLRFDPRAHLPWWRASLLAAPAFAVPAASFAAIAVFARYDNPNRVGGLGLITVIPLPILLAALALSASFGLLLYRTADAKESSRLLTAALVVHVVALLLVVHGLSGLLEAQPRFGTSWLHAGFVDALTKNHHPLKGVDARFSWPGFFAAGSALIGAAGLPTALPLLRFAPLVFETAYLLPVALLARTLVPTPAGRWMMVWLFCLGNWVGQDYFAPQAFGYLLMLTILALVCAALAAPATTRSEAAQAGSQPRHRAPVAGWSMAFVRWVVLVVDRVRALVRRALATRPASAIVRSVGADSRELRRMPAPPAVGVILVAVFSFAALVTAHQFTPVVLTIDLAALVVARRCTARLLPLAFTVLVVGWISYAAVDFWSGHLSTLLGNGSVSSAVNANVSARIQGSSAHLAVVQVRILISLMLWLLALIGAVRVIRGGRRLVVAACILAVVPFPVLAAQSYGGEAQLRLYLYTMPFMVALAVRLFLPGRQITRRGVGAFIALAMLATPAFYIARFGNEQFEQVRSGEVQAVRTLYATAPPGATLVSVGSNVFWRYRDFVSYNYKSATLTSSPVESERAVVKLMGDNPRGSYLLFTRGQIAAEISTGLPSGLGAELVSAVEDSGQFQLVYANPDARVYRFLQNAASG